MEIKEIREISGISRPTFAKKYNIPYRTLQSWEIGDRECPAYAKEWLERIVKEDYQTLETEKEKLLKRLAEIEKKLSEN